MRKNTTLIALAVSMTAALAGRSETTVTVAFTDPEAAPVTVAVTTDTKMNFGSEAMLSFADVAGRPAPIPLSKISRITFDGTWSGVAKIRPEGPALRIVENPVGDELLTEGHDTSRPSTLRIFSIAGRETVRINSWNGERVNVSSLPKGVYILQADNVTLKFVKR